MLLVTGSQSKNVSCFCLDMAQWQSLIGQSLCNAIYWSNMGFSVYWYSRLNVRIEYIEMTAYGVLTCVVLPKFCFCATKSVFSKIKL
jgi:hypothetical protein